MSSGTQPLLGSVSVERQWKKIDLLAVVNDEVVIPVEDKTHTKNHSGQLGRYLDQLRKRFPPTRYSVAPIYLKTGDQCSYDEVRIVRSSLDHFVIRKPESNYFNLLREKLSFGKRD